LSSLLDALLTATAQTRAVTELTNLNGSSLAQDRHLFCWYTTVTTCRSAYCICISLWKWINLRYSNWLSTDDLVCQIEGLAIRLVQINWSLISVAEWWIVSYLWLISELYQLYGGTAGTAFDVMADVGSILCEISGRGVQFLPET